jgi:hypothetical protein
MYSYLRTILVGGGVLALVVPLMLHAAVMTGSSYRVQFDSLNVGGNNSVSSSYRAEDTVGEIGTGESSSASYVMKAGYQQMNESFIDISTETDVTMSSIGGVTGGSSTGSQTWTVITDNEAGYSLTVKASTNPAMQGSGGAFFANYTPGASPDYDFSVAAGTSEFGFSPEGTHIVQRYLDNGSNACNQSGGTDSANKCWDAFSTIDTTIAQSTTSNHPSGTDTTIKFRADIGTSKIQDEGTYQATITVTALTL